MNAQQKQVLREVVHRVWNIIGIYALRDAQGKLDPTMTLSAEEVVELCLDAERWLDYGNVSEEEFRPIIDELTGLGFGSPAWVQTIREIMPNKTYGY